MEDASPRPEPEPVKMSPEEAEQMFAQQERLHALRRAESAGNHSMTLNAMGVGVEGGSPSSPT